MEEKDPYFILAFLKYSVLSQEISALDLGWDAAGMETIIHEETLPAGI